MGDYYLRLSGPCQTGSNCIPTACSTNIMCSTYTPGSPCEVEPCGSDSICDTDYTKSNWPNTCTACPASLRTCTSGPWETVSTCICTVRSPGMPYHMSPCEPGSTCAVAPRPVTQSMYNITTPMTSPSSTTYHNYAVST